MKLPRLILTSLMLRESILKILPFRGMGKNSHIVFIKLLLTYKGQLAKLRYGKSSSYPYPFLTRCIIKCHITISNSATSKNWPALLLTSHRIFWSASTIVRRCARCSPDLRFNLSNCPAAPHKIHAPDAGSSSLQI